METSEWTWWFVLPRFGSKEPSPRWGGHKVRVSFNPFPLSNGHLDRVSFLLNQNGSLRPRKNHHTLGVSCFDYKSLGNKNEEGRKRSKQQERKEHEQTLSQVTRWLEWFWDLERLWSFDLCLGVNALALVLNGNFRKLGSLELWWLGVFIALNHQQAVGDGCCRWAHRTVRCATGQVM
jgi:hypothetical protein